MITAEKAEKLAQNLLYAADKIGNIMNILDVCAKRNWQAISDETESYEKIILEGPDFIKAMRTLAMRLDRASLIKTEEK